MCWFAHSSFLRIPSSAHLQFTKAFIFSRVFLLTFFFGKGICQFTFARGGSVFIGFSCRNLHFHFFRDCNDLATKGLGTRGLAFSNFFCATPPGPRLGDLSSTLSWAGGMHMGLSHNGKETGKQCVHRLKGKSWETRGLASPRTFCATPLGPRLNSPFRGKAVRARVGATMAKRLASNVSRGSGAKAGKQEVLQCQLHCWHVTLEPQNG